MPSKSSLDLREMQSLVQKRASRERMPPSCY
jgi:hypothetical protein